MISVSTDKTKLDIPFIHNFLKDIYWSAPRTLAEVQICIENSFCFGIYLDGKQIGFARAITDYVVFAYVMDVFIEEKHRGNGYSSILIDAMMSEPELKQIKIWRLATTDRCAFFVSKIRFQCISTSRKINGKNYFIKTISLLFKLKKTLNRINS